MFNKTKRKVFSRRRRAFQAPSVFNAGKGLAEKKKGVPLTIKKIFVFCLGLLTLIFFVFFSNVFTVNDVIVEGNSLVPTEEIIRALPVNKNIFRLNIIEEKERLLRTFPEIKNLEIFRGIPNAIKIVVLERDSRFLWQSAENIYLVSSQGEIVRQLSIEEIGGYSNIPKVVDKKGFTVTPGASIVSSPSFVSFITNVYEQFFEATNIKPLHFEIEETTFDINLYTEAGFYVKFNSLRSSKKQLENLKKVLVERRQDVHEYVDLRIDGWAYYK